MKKIKILGTGCPKCKKMEAIVREAVNELGLVVEIEKIEDIQKIMEYNVMTTPVLVIDDQVKIKGRVPLSEEAKALLQENI